MLYWRFLADVFESGNAKLRWSYLSTRPGKRVNNSKSPIVVSLVDTEGSILSRVQTSVALAMDGGSNGIVSGAVPFHPATARILIAHGDVVLLSTEVPRQKPTVSLCATEIQPGGIQRIEWEATAANRERLTSSVFFQLGDSRRYPVLNHSRATSVEIDMDAIPGCVDGRIIVRVSDGVWTAEAASEPFQLPNKLPIVWINRPRPGKPVAASQPLQLEGRGWDVQAQRPLPDRLLEWFFDGQAVGVGKLCIVHTVMTGAHSIILRATDSNGLKTHREVRFFAKKIHDNPDKETFPSHINFS